MLESVVARHYFLEDRLVLYSELSRTLSVLNPTAGFIWLRYLDGSSQEAIAADLARQFPDARASVVCDVRDCFERWRSAGFLSETGSNETPPPAAPGQGSPIGTSPNRKTLDRSFATERSYRSLDFAVCVRYENETLESWVHPVLAHLEVPGEPRDIPSIEVATGDAGYQAVMTDGTLRSCATLEELAPFVHSHVLWQSFATADWLVTFHSAVVCHGEHAVLLPGTSGSGKSTLTAALVASGLTYGSDEVAVLTRRTLDVRPLRGCMSIKSGSWPLLEPFLPKLRDLAVHVRSDGRSVRFLPPPDGPAPDDLPVKALVFPQVARDGRTELREISRSNAFERLLEDAFATNPAFDAQDAESLVGWIGARPCYELATGNLGDAVALVREILA